LSRRSRLAGGAIAAAAVAAIALPVASSAHPSGHHDGDHPGHHDGDGRGHRGHGAIAHVLLISVDGLHQSDPGKGKIDPRGLRPLRPAGGSPPGHAGTPGGTLTR
jgi:hypothetical protein